MNKEPDLGLYDILQEIFKNSPYEFLLQTKLDLARNTLGTDEAIEEKTTLGNGKGHLTEQPTFNLEEITNSMRDMYALGYFYAKQQNGAESEVIGGIEIEPEVQFKLSKIMVSRQNKSSQ